MWTPRAVEAYRGLLQEKAVQRELVVVLRVRDEVVPLHVVAARDDAHAAAPTAPASSTPATPTAGTSPPCAAPARPRVDALEHRRVLQHVRDDQETNLAASDIDVLQLVHTAVAARVRDSL